MCKLSPEECNLSKLPAVGASRESSWMLHWISKATTETVPQLHHPKVGLFNPYSGSPWQPTILSFSLGLCPMGTPCPDCRTEGPGSHPRALSKLTRITSWQTSNCHLVSRVCCLGSLFGVRLISQFSNGTEWDCQIMILSIFFPYPLTCNLKINTQAPRGCDNFSKQNWK